MICHCVADSLAGQVPSSRWTESNYMKEES